MGRAAATLLRDALVKGRADRLGLGHDSIVFETLGLEEGGVETVILYVVGALQVNKKLPGVAARARISSF